ncbi:DUF4114 domain-containing protein [Leptothoe kymatousa]|uniref:DUF4114 domain-containing protein n=1 Tax=Leptothoe kymatousa TAU-MAC 1615 TaxID=2364775 RepID=A0ABS5Y1Q7_9CYAN|nr:DUF4114 domain-containing protein [Leptothoe kymatousa]MBT9311769.1 DUF4114 domain-containing protein [Leptothoe kymatousa TAU-MAC 1615]
MNRHFLLSGLVTLAGTVAAFMPTAAHAYSFGGPLTNSARDLLAMDASATGYDAHYSEVKSAYLNQASDYSLGFDDWVTMTGLIYDQHVEGVKQESLNSIGLETLTWEAGANDVEVFFVNEGAGYWNQFGYGVDVTSPVTSFNNSEVTTIWNSLASVNSAFANGGSMSLGEGYKIGDVSEGDTLDFFLRNGPGNVFDSLAASETANADGLQHVSTYQHNDFLVLAYEDLYGGGDEDYNDVVIAVRGLKDTEITEADAADVPEPSAALALLGLSFAGKLLKRKQG